MNSSRVPETFANFSGFPEKFWFCTDMPGSIERLNHAPRLHIGGTTPPLPLLHGALEICPLTDLAISVNKEMSINTAYTDPHVSWMWALTTFHEKNWRVNRRVKEFHHPQNSLNSCSHSRISEHNGSSHSINNRSPRSLLGCFHDFLEFSWLGLHRVFPIFHQSLLT